MEHYLAALATVLQPHNVAAMILGSLWGLLAGALPGISTSMGVVLLLSFTYTLSPMTAFILLVGAYLGGITGVLLLPSFLEYQENLPQCPRS